MVYTFQLISLLHYSCPYEVSGCVRTEALSEALSEALTLAGVLLLRSRVTPA